MKETDRVGGERNREREREREIEGEKDRERKMTPIKIDGLSG